MPNSCTQLTHPVISYRSRRRYRTPGRAPSACLRIIGLRINGLIGHHKGSELLLMFAVRERGVRKGGYKKM